MVGGQVGGRLFYIRCACGDMTSQERYAVYFYEVHGEGGVSLLVVTPQLCS